MSEEEQDSTPIDQQVAWNLSSQLIIEISQLLSHANNHYLQGSANKAFFDLKAVKFRIIHDLSPEERNQLKIAELEFCKALSLNDKGFVAFEKYNELIMDKLNKYGYTIKKKDDISRMNA